MLAADGERRVRMVHGMVQFVLGNVARPLEDQF